MTRCSRRCWVPCHWSSGPASWTREAQQTLCGDLLSQTSVTALSLMECRFRHSARPGSSKRRAPPTLRSLPCCVDVLVCLCATVSAAWRFLGHVASNVRKCQTQGGAPVPRLCLASRCPVQFGGQRCCELRSSGPKIQRSQLESLVALITGGGRPQSRSRTSPFASATASSDRTCRTSHGHAPSLSSHGGSSLTGPAAFTSLRRPR